MFSTGDGHAREGEGEVCGVALECRYLSGGCGCEVRKEFANSSSPSASLPGCRQAGPAKINTALPQVSRPLVIDMRHQLVLDHHQVLLIFHHLFYGFVRSGSLIDQFTGLVRFPGFARRAPPSSRPLCAT